jgi:prepilin-type N-terminal cleavage/methylation domain-containing protein
MRHTSPQQKGVTIVEVMIGIVILSIAMVFIFHTFTLFFAAQRLTVQNAQAIYLAEEGQEMMRYLRDDNWTTFSALAYDTARYLSIATTTIVTTATPEVIDSTFTRTITVRRAYRNGSDDYVASTTPGATVDSGSRLVEVSVTWGTNNGVRLYTLLTNIHDI